MHFSCVVNISEILETNTKYIKEVKMPIRELNKNKQAKLDLGNKRFSFCFIRLVIIFFSPLKSKHKGLI